MRRTFYVSLATLLMGASAIIASPVFAADAGTYRPGNAYNSIAAGSADVCDMQCSGDAQCRSWNFVRVNDTAQGVCEFNDNMSSPVPSAISISGDNVSRARAAKVVTGKTNTVRVGAPSVTQPRTASQRTTKLAGRSQPARAQTRPAPTAQYAGLSLMEQQRLNNRRVKPTPPRAPLPQYRPAAPQTQPQRSAASRIPNPRAQLRHNLDDNSRFAAPASAPHPAAAPQQRRQSAPTAQPTYAMADPRLQKRLAQQQNGTAAAQTYPLATPPQPAQSTAHAGGLSAPPGVPPLNSAVPALAQSSYMSPTMAGAPRPPSSARVSIPSELSPRPMGSGDSLFGSLYDDVKVPRPIDPAIAADPDAPITTVTSVPTQSPLGPQL